MPDSSLSERQSRWRGETSFFDRAFAGIEPAQIHPRTLRRYQGRLRSRFSKEFRLSLLGDVTGTDILDVGCGGGKDSVLLAKLGARVTGIDISPQSIEVACQRARINGVADACRFICSPLETAALAPDSFDAVWCDAILHHVIAELPCVLDRLTHWARPGALLIFGEPVNFSATLRRIRAMLPIQTDATPDERPLGPAEIAIIRRYVRDLKIRPFGLFSRLDRFLLPRYNYELAAWSRRAASNICAAVDAAVLASPFLQSLAGSAVLYGYPAKS